MLFYYLCTIGEKLHREAYPQGAQSKDADVYKWVLLHSGSPAVCQREHPAEHRWRPDEGGDEERVVRNPRRIEESGHVELRRRLRVRREQKMHVVALGEARAPRFAELRRPRGPVARTRRLRERVQLPVEHRELVRRIALVARAAKAEAKRELDDIDVRLWPHEPHRR